MLEIHINLPKKDNDIVSEIKNLPKIQPLKQVKSTPDDEGFSLTKLKKGKGKKKKDKKNKKKSELNFMMNGEIGEFDRPVDEFDEAASKLIDAEHFFDEEDEDEDLSIKIIDKQYGSYDKFKKNENTYYKEFSEELVLLYGLLQELNDFGKKLDDKVSEMEKSKTRGVSKYLNDLIESVLSSKQNKLNIIKEIANIKKTIIDLKIKADAKSKDDIKDNNSDYVAASFLKNIVKYGRNNFIQDAGSMSNSGGPENITDLMESIGNDEYSEEEIDDYNEDIEERLLNEENPFRSAEGNKYIEYENRDVSVKIRRNIDSGEWDFIAIDRDNQEIFDYPLPTKKAAGKVKFSDDGRYATDEKSRIYKVIELLSDEGNEEEDED